MLNEGLFGLHCQGIAVDHKQRPRNNIRFKQTLHQSCSRPSFPRSRRHLDQHFLATDIDLAADGLDANTLVCPSSNAAVDGNLKRIAPKVPGGNAAL
ncbi:hypothetical protein D9M72_537920 [compost metagenome]